MTVITNTSQSSLIWLINQKFSSQSLAKNKSLEYLLHEIMSIAISLEETTDDLLSKDHFFYYARNSRYFLGTLTTIQQLLNQNFPFHVIPSQSLFPLLIESVAINLESHSEFHFPKHFNIFLQGLLKNPFGFVKEDFAPFLKSLLERDQLSLWQNFLEIEDSKGNESALFLKEMTDSFFLPEEFKNSSSSLEKIQYTLISQQLLSLLKSHEAFDLSNVKIAPLFNHVVAFFHKKIFKDKQIDLEAYRHEVKKELTFSHEINRCLKRLFFETVIMTQDAFIVIDTIIEGIVYHKVASSLEDKMGQSCEVQIKELFLKISKLLFQKEMAQLTLFFYEESLKTQNILFLSLFLRAFYAFLYRQGIQLPEESLPCEDNFNQNKEFIYFLITESKDTLKTFVERFHLSSFILQPIFKCCKELDIIIEKRKSITQT